MKPIITNYRYWVLFALFNVIILGLLAVPQDTTSSLLYVLLLVGSKLLALAALITFCLLYITWEDQGAIPELTNITKEE